MRLLAYLLLWLPLATSANESSLPNSHFFGTSAGHKLHVYKKSPNSLSESQKSQLNDLGLKTATLSPTTKVVLLSGPTDHWNSDGAWFGLLQNLLSSQFDTYLVESASFGMSEHYSAPSYRQFALDLKDILPKFIVDDLVIVSFASSNITVNLLLQDSGIAKHVKGVVMLDPDVLTPFSISRYSSDAEPFKKNLERYSQYIDQGKYLGRTQQINEKERKQITDLIPQNMSSLVDWPLIDGIFSARERRGNQKGKFTQVADYAQDLEAAVKSSYPKNTPLIIYDSDFELAYLDTVEEEQKEGIQRWEREGKQWYQRLTSANKMGIYRHLSSREHLITFTHAQQILQDVINLSRL